MLQTTPTFPVFLPFSCLATSCLLALLATSAATGTVSDVSGIATLTVKVNGETYMANVAGMAWSADVTHMLPDNTYEVLAEATDSAGNTGSDASTYELQVATPPPVDADFAWARGMGGASTDNGNGIVVDAAGNVYTTGGFEGTVDFDPGADTFNLTSAGGRDIYVSKLDSSGNLVWARALGGSSDDIGRSIAVDAAGNVYTTGTFRGPIDFGSESTSNLGYANGLDIFVWKLDSSGNLVWARAMGGSGHDIGYGIAVDAGGNVYTTGTFQWMVDFDPDANSYNYLESAGSYDIFVSKLDSSGNFVWALRMGGTGLDEGFGIAVDAAGNLYTTGYFQGTVDFDPGADISNLVSAGGRDIFVSQFDSSGNLVWARALGGNSDDLGYSIAVDAAGNVHTTGIFQGYIDFGSESTNNLGGGNGFDIFVWKLDSSGNLVWARAMIGSGHDIGYGIAVDAGGNVYTTGTFQWMVDFDPDANSYNYLESAGSYDIFVSKLDSSGNFVWARAMGGTSDDRGFGIAVDVVGNVYTTGYFQGTVDFDPGLGISNLVSSGGQDAFVSKLSGPPDTTAPTAQAITPATTGPTNATSIDFTVTFDEAVQNFNNAADLVVTHTGTAHTGVSISGSGDSYTVTVSGISGDGSFTLAVNTASDVEDLAGNALASSETSDSVVLDNTAPTVSISAPFTTLPNAGPVAQAADGVFAWAHSMGDSYGL